MAPRQHNATEFNPNGLPMQRVGTYRREVAASLARAWENVFDWEHLPWLHADSFSQCHLDEAGHWGWRARTKGVGAAAEQESVIELVVDKPALRYVSRTLQGPLPGVEIWTSFTRLEEHKTGVEVEFFLPHLSADQAARAGAGLVRLYTKLWDEDEAMMVARQIALDAKAAPRHEPIHLGALDALRPRLPLLVDTGSVPIRVVSIGGTLHAYATRCPHMLGPLDEVEPDAKGVVTCPWHGFSFNVATGLSADGRGLKLGACPRIDIDNCNEVTLVWP